MAFCSNCGEKLNDGADFCHVCGLAINDTPVQRKQEYDGKIIKCPNCGEILDSFIYVCPVCHYELRGTQTTSHVHELSQMLEKAQTDEQKAEMISNFYIPNTKEDIYEFFILAYSNVSANGYCSDAWSVKLEQAYLKAKIAFEGGKELKYIEELYTKINRVSARNKIAKSKLMKAGVIFSVGLLMVLGGLITAFYQDIGRYDSVPFLMIAGVGVIPFVVGLIMLITPEKRNSKKRERK